MKRPLRAQKRVFNQQKVVTLHQEDDDAKWLTHYCSDHQILLVGDGDFSFSLCLAKAFGSASNIVASSLDTYGEVTRKYKDARSNLDELHKLGACVLHGVDATKLEFYPHLNMRRFDRVIFNFPHAGFHGKEDDLLLIEMHRELVFGFFKKASRMLRANGEIHVNHKTTYPFDNWNIETLAMQSFLILIECVDFNKEDYPGYNNKRGDSARCDEPFPLGKCSTFKFIYNPRVQKYHMRRNDMEISRQQTSLPSQEIRNLEQLPDAVALNCYPQTSIFPNGYSPILRDYVYNNVNVKEIHGRVASSADLGNRYIPIFKDYNSVTEIERRVASSADLRNGHTPISRDYFKYNVTEMHRRVDSSADCYYRVQQIPLEEQWPTSSTCRYSTTDSFRRTMDIAPSLSVGARNENFKYQVFGGSSRYLQEELCRSAGERPSYCSEYDKDRTDFERYIANGAMRMLKLEIEE